MTSEKMVSLIFQPHWVFIINIDKCVVFFLLIKFLRPWVRRLLKLRLTSRKISELFLCESQILFRRLPDFRDGNWLRGLFNNLLHSCSLLGNEGGIISSRIFLGFLNHFNFIIIEHTALLFKRAISFCFVHRLQTLFVF